MLRGVKRSSTTFPLVLRDYAKTIKDDNKDLRIHQQIPINYFLTSNIRGMLVFHSTGMGKTRVAAYIASKVDRKVIVLSAKTLHSQFEREHSLFGDGKINYVSINSSNAVSQISKIGKTKTEIDFEKTIDSDPIKILSKLLDNSLLIIDEVQNILNAIVNGSKNATALYNSIMNSDVRLIAMSATPVINDPFELVPLFNMLHGDKTNLLFTDDWIDFRTYFVEDDTRIKNKQLFQNRIIGLVSHAGDWWSSDSAAHSSSLLEKREREGFPTQLPLKIWKIPMSTAQFLTYGKSRESERGEGGWKGKAVKLQKPQGMGSSTYRIKSRTSSNYNRVEKVDLKTLNTHSPKMKKMLENVLQDMKFRRLSLVYSAFVSKEGLGYFSILLKESGCKLFSSKTQNKKTHAIISGDVKAEDRVKILKIFNSKQNVNGEIISILLISSAASEGTDLKNVKAVHIMEPYWHMARLKQVVARAVRYKSHEDSKLKIVQPHIYLSDYPKTYAKKIGEEETTDVYLFNRAIKNKILIESFNSAMVEASLDCSFHSKKSKAPLKCVKCSPDDKKLFNEFYEDMKLPNPCKQKDEERIDVKEIMYDGNKYAYTVGKITTIYKYQDKYKAYSELSMSNPEYEVVKSLI